MQADQVIASVCPYRRKFLSTSILELSSEGQHQLPGTCPHGPHNMQQFPEHWKDLPAWKAAIWIPGP